MYLPYIKSRYTTDLEITKSIVYGREKPAPRKFDVENLKIPPSVIIESSDGFYRYCYTNVLSTNFDTIFDNYPEIAEDIWNKLGEPDKDLVCELVCYAYMVNRGFIVISSITTTGALLELYLENREMHIESAGIWRKDGVVYIGDLDRYEPVMKVSSSMTVRDFMRKILTPDMLTELSAKS